MITLPDDDPDIVKVYIQWLYFGKIPLLLIHEDIDEMTDEEMSEASSSLFSTLATAYVFGEKYHDMVFKGAVLAHMINISQLYEWTPGPETVKITYTGTKAGSPMRRLLADYAAHSVTVASSYSTELESYPRDALLDILRTIFEAGRESAEEHESHLDLPWVPSAEDYLDGSEV